MQFKDNKIDISWRKHLQYSDYWQNIGAYVRINNNKIIRLELPLCHHDNFAHKLRKLAKNNYKSKDTVIIEGVYDNEDTDEVCTADFVFTYVKFDKLELSFENKRNYVESNNDMGKVLTGIDYIRKKAKYIRECGGDIQDWSFTGKWV